MARARDKLDDASCTSSISFCSFFVPGAVLYYFVTDHGPHIDLRKYETAVREVLSLTALWRHNGENNLRSYRGTFSWTTTVPFQPNWACTFVLPVFGRQINQAAKSKSAVTRASFDDVL